MKSLYEPETLAKVKQRLATLTADSPRAWGKMTVPQMLAHCSAAMETATGDVVIPRLFIGRILGPFVRPGFTNDKPLSKNGPTAPSFTITNDRDFEIERARLILLLERFHQAGHAGCTTHPHCFFGNLTPEQWGKGMYKHIDHHLQQFNA